MIFARNCFGIEQRFLELTRKYRPRLNCMLIKLRKMFKYNKLWIPFYKRNNHTPVGYLTFLGFYFYRKTSKHLSVGYTIFCSSVYGFLICNFSLTFQFLVYKREKIHLLLYQWKNSSLFMCASVVYMHFFIYIISKTLLFVLWFMFMTAK